MTQRKENQKNQRKENQNLNSYKNIRESPLFLFVQPMLQT